MEEWRPITGYENEYHVSNLGRVWSVRSERLLKPKSTRTGYLRVTLSVNNTRKTFGVHRLVALAFIPNPDSKPTVNHINEDKSDNRVENLEWATHREQNVHGTRIARAVANTDWRARTEKIDYSVIAAKHDYRNMNASQKRRVVQQDIHGNTLQVFDSLGDAARHVGVSVGHIWECCNGRRKTSRGCVWKYA